MNSSSALQILLHLSDSSLPVGRFAHSFGLEPLAMEGLIEGEEELLEYLITNLRDCFAPLDGVAVSWSYRHFSEGNFRALHDLDNLVTCRKIIPSTRLASKYCGRELIRILSEISISMELNSFTDQISRQKKGGNLSVVIGAASAAAGIGIRECVVMEMRSAVSSLLSAAVRLGLLSALSAQRLLWQSAGIIEEAAEISLGLDQEAMATWFPDADAYSLRHRFAFGRNFGS
ncbi:urease accessory protein UreF [Leisingera daeponensis]|uniref:urease accessory protein UreF n=1 Tax=Leisingera daeponensis TaxID=405746 RepID=UPI001C958BDE|nr:urease accessory UreF family protein [Leisingera daeponensis]MBY6059594.1 hypothetical protein [Leisingera daeponensis]